MVKFNVGDRVMIRYWDDMKAEYGVRPDGFLSTGTTGVVFNKEMKDLSGRMATISGFGVDGDRVTLKDWDSPDGYQHWDFTTGMLILVKSAPTPPPAKKMTIAEVEKALGYEIELVSEK